MTEASDRSRIGKYEIVGTLGRGASGVVYKARDPEIGRVVAVKTLRKLLSNDLQDGASSIERFKAEARSAGNLRHPNIITIFEANIDGDTPYIVMDYVEGTSLDHLIKQQGKLAPEMVLHYIQQIAAGVDAAHARGVIHRDIKPSNIIVEPSGNVLILDFGIAHMSESLPQGAGPVLGTPGYMAPEQILNEKIDHRSDIFSLAIVAFECFCGQRPFPGENFTVVISNILNTKPISLTLVAPNLPKALEEAFDKALARNKEDRFASAKDMVKAFARALGYDRVPSSTDLRAGVEPRRRRKSSAWRSLARITGVGGYDDDAKALPVAPRDFVPATPGAASFDIPRRGPSSPGQMFGELPEHLRPAPIARSPRLNLWRAGAAGVGAVCIGLAVVLVLMVTGHWGKRAVENGGVAPRPTGAEPTVSLPMGAEIETPPASAAATEMSDGELRGVLASAASSETDIIKALKEVGRRKISGVLELSRALLQSDSYLVRVEVLKTFAAIEEKSAVPIILETLDDHDPVVRATAAETLGVLGSRSAVAYMTNKYNTEENAEVKYALKSAIERINGFPMQ